MVMSSSSSRIRSLLPSLIAGLVLTVLFSLFSSYEMGVSHHFLHNGLPLPTLTQVIDPVQGELIRVELNPLGIAVDFAFFFGVWTVARMISAWARRRPSEA